MVSLVFVPHAAAESSNVISVRTALFDRPRTGLERTDYPILALKSERYCWLQWSQNHCKSHFSFYQILDPLNGKSGTLFLSLLPLVFSGRLHVSGLTLQSLLGPLETRSQWRWPAAFDVGLSTKTHPAAVCFRFLFYEWVSTFSDNVEHFFHISLSFFL